MPEVPSIGHGTLRPVNHTTGAAAYQGTEKARQTIEPRSDRVELSRLAQLLDQLRHLPDVRQDLVDRVRAAIAEGTYETPQKLELAISRLLEEPGAIPELFQ